MAKSSGMGVTVLAVVVSIAVAGGGGYMLGARAAQPDLKAVASVNGETITQTAVYEKLVDQGGREVVQRMIDEKLVEQAAKAANVTVSKAEIDAEINKIRDRIGGEEALKSAMLQYGISMEQLREDQLHRLRITKILSKDIKTDDATLQKFFEENKGTFDTREVHSRHILVETEAEAKAIKAELDKGGDFAKLAQEKSTDPGSKETGGDLGFNPQGRMVPEFDQVVFSLTKGQISAPFQTQFGWHIVQVLDTKGDAPVFAALKEKVKDAYIQDEVQERIQPWLDELRAKAKISNTLDKQ